MTISESITANIKHAVFDSHYISVEKLFGNELKDFIQEEVKSLSKKIRLGIRGERSEMLAKDGAFVKELVFALVKNSLHYSLEPVFRRRATEKSETAWLLIEFEDFGDTFNIYIRDDGRGLMPDQMHISSIETSVMDRGGSVEIDSMDGEYLKIHIQLPAKRIFIDCLAVETGGSNILIPDRYIDKIVSAKEVPAYRSDENFMGQINLSTLLGLDHSPANAFVVCRFGAHKIIFGVEKILYNIEAVVENVDSPLIDGVDSVSILKDNSIGFIINERKIYQMAKDLIQNRENKREV